MDVSNPYYQTPEYDNLDFTMTATVGSSVNVTAQGKNILPYPYSTASGTVAGVEFTVRPPLQ